jgi:pimeloyl-ACP methyl ester carboxylesterase
MVILTIPLLVVVVVLLVFQDDLIYLPRRYPADLSALLPPGAEVLEYRTGQGDQASFWCPPRAGGAPTRVWLLFGGNGALALDWGDLVAAHPDAHAGFLLVDYPGYGRCAGAPSPSRIGEASTAAFAALAAKLGQPVEELARRSAVLGHSLGAAAASQFAARQGVPRVVLVSPFTDLRAMARGTVGWPLCWLLRGNFDNRARLAEVVAHDPAASVAILHGSADEVIPVAMGRDLAAGLGARATFTEIPGADHNGILALAETEILAAMAR